MLSLLYNLIFMPIEMLVEMTYSFVHRLLGNVGLSIIAVSLVIQTLVLPLYKRADAMQDEERQRQKDMEHWVNHIKRTFTGDERYMMLSTYYREQNYKSWYGIKSSASILLQIPFFTAAYRFLSNLQELSGVSFLFIKDLSKPDMSFVIGSFAINVLPILMTLINIVSGIIYTKNLKFREKAQVYGLAVVFLVLLYDSPSGLVLYWTMNNAYSLIKNIVLKVLNRKLHLFKKKAGLNATDWVESSNDTNLYYTYIIGALFLTLFIGGIILLNVVDSSAAEFINYEHGPIYLVISNMMIYAGIFIIWGSVFFAFMTYKVRKVFTKSIVILSVVAIVDFMFFGLNLGRMSPLFFYEGGFENSITDADKLINFLFVILAVLMASLLYKKKRALTNRIMQIIVVSAAVMCVFIMIGVYRQVQDYNTNKELTSVNTGQKIFNLSTENQNVIVIMLDRAISGFIPYIFAEKPEIAEMYEDFTYYPQTISFGNSTNLSTPSLFGGYEYTPDKINERSDESLQDKHNEALLLMPALFSENNYNVTVCDPPYAGNYSNVNDLSIYDQYDNVRAYNIKGAFMGEFDEFYSVSYQAKQENMAFYYCLMKSLPTVLQPYLYNSGGYCSKKEITVNKKFLEAYSTLLNLDNITDISGSGKGGFLLIQNITTHENSPISVPDYNPIEGSAVNVDEELDYYATLFADEKDEFSLDNSDVIEQYQSNLVSLRAVGEWFNYLRNNNCWDNTRIIIVSDHGKRIGCFSKMLFSDGLDITSYNPLLLVKDFNAKGFSASEEFMTLADVPYLAMNGIIDDAVNPFTGQKISIDDKENAQKVTTSRHYKEKNKNTNTFDISDGNWYEVTPGNIFDESNWKLVD